MIKKKMITQKNNGVGGFGMDVKNNNPNKYIHRKSVTQVPCTTLLNK